MMIRICVGACPVAHAGACMEMHFCPRDLGNRGLLSLTPVIPLRALSPRVVAEDNALVFPRGFLFAQGFDCGPIVAPGARLVGTYA